MSVPPDHTPSPHRRPGRLRRRTLGALAALPLLAGWLTDAYPRPIPANVDSGLAQLLQERRDQRAAAAGVTPSAAAADQASVASTLPDLVKDKKGRVRVTVHLRDGANARHARRRAQRLGGQLASRQTRFPEVFTVFLPLGKVSALAAGLGVRSVILSPQAAAYAVKSVVNPALPVLRITAPGDPPFSGIASSFPLPAPNIGGRGITVGVLSTSFDRSRLRLNNLKPNADDDIKSGDLPGPGNPNGYTTPVRVLEDYPANLTRSLGDPGDEGRAMCQILHDIAPAAKLVFATATTGEDAFAANILNLADKTQGGCDIIVDDVGYNNEGVYSDTLVAQAVNAVTDQGVIYLSAAGNGGGGTYNGTFTPVADAVARSGGVPGSNLNFSNVPAALTAGGFHNFGAAEGTVDISWKVTIPKPVFNPNNPDALASLRVYLQWDDPFNQGKISADYRLLVFSNAGRYVASFSGTGDPVQFDQPIQSATVVNSGDPQSGGFYDSYQLVVARADGGTGGASHFRIYDVVGELIPLNHRQLLSAAIYGHQAAAGAITVGATYWNAPQGAELFSSPGPATIYVDGVLGSRLPQAEVRLKPEISAADGVPTTFFSTPPNADSPKFPVFFGTSAAAPHAAGVAALLLQEAGGPGALTPDLMRRVLTKTGQSHPATPAQVVVHNAADPAGHHVDLEIVSVDRNNPFRFFLRDNGNGPQTEKTTALLPLRSFQIDLTSVNPVFRTDSFTVGAIFNVPGPSQPPALTAADVTATVPTTETSTVENPPGTFTTSTFGKVLTLDFTDNHFSDGRYLTFNLDFRLGRLDYLGNNPNLLDGARYQATFTDGFVLAGEIKNSLSQGYSVLDGYGLVDAKAAATLLYNLGLYQPSGAPRQSARPATVPEALRSLEFIRHEPGSGEE